MQRASKSIRTLLGFTGFTRTRLQGDDVTSNGEENGVDKVEMNDAAKGNDGAETKSDATASSADRTGDGMEDHPVPTHRNPYPYQRGATGHRHQEIEQQQQREVPPQQQQAQPQQRQQAQPQRSQQTPQQVQQQEQGEDLEPEPDATWHSATAQWFKTIKKEFDKRVSLKANGELDGNFPNWALGPICAQQDPLGEHLLNGPSNANRAPRNLQMSDFCLPDLVIWVPEYRWPLLYNHKGRPKCPWHNAYKCVSCEGWVTLPRHCYDEKSVTALLGKKYKCKEREQRRNEHGGAFYFRGYDSRVLAKAPVYVQDNWRNCGFYCAHKGAIRWLLLDQFRSSLALGMGLSGCRKALCEAYKSRHSSSSRMWLDYCNFRHANQAATEVVMFRRTQFAAFTSAEYGGMLPSMAYIIMCVIQDIESRIEYYDRRNQLVDGRFWKVDHSHKVTKLIFAYHQRAYSALFIVMNEYLQVLYWELVGTTSLEEVKKGLEKLVERFEIRGFSGVESLTTDRCCSERNFWNTLLRKWFKVEPNEELDEQDLVSSKIAHLPVSEKYSDKSTGINVLVGQISKYLRKQNTDRKVIAIDTECKS